MVQLDFFLRLPPTTSLLVFASLLPPISSHALPRQTKTVELRAFDVQAWPLPTEAPISPAELFGRQLNTVCGYVGGNAELPATCSAGSHCAVDTGHGVVGCCPDGGACTQGLFTGCVDFNSGPQTEISPYVFTCGGSNVCYKNTFEGGYHQYGCGSASDMATNVAMTASGRESLHITSVHAALTATPTSLSEPTTIGTKRPKTSSSHTKKHTSSTSTKSRTSSSTTKPSSSSTTQHLSTASSSMSATPMAKSAPKSHGNNSNHTGAIIGGSIGGVVALVALLALGVWLWRRKRGNSRRGPGMNQDTRYISPMSNNGHDFATLAPIMEDDERLPQGLPRSYGGIPSGMSDDGRQPAYGNVSTVTSDVNPPLHRSDRDYGYGPDSYGEEPMAVGGSHMMTEPDRMPLTREFDDFSRGFNTALDDIRDDDEQHSNMDSMAPYPGGRGGNGGRPLWQQNRRQSRNMMWM